MAEPLVARCHCGAVEIAFAGAPREVVRCNCSLCHKFGVIWAYPDAAEITLPEKAALTQTYAWNGKHVDFHRCANCGCLTHWVPRDASRKRRGVNARLLPIEVLKAAKVTLRDGSGTGQFID